jgi:hyperosmotically inducible protein
MLLAASFTLGAAAHAQPADFSALDRNGDGYLTRLEVAAHPDLAKRFAQFDTDRDRRWSVAEYESARQDNEQRAQRDAAVTARVKAALTAERGIPSTAISVETYEGEVLLSGFVPAPDMASRAGRISAGVSGVRTVQNNLLVGKQR